MMQPSLSTPDDPFPCNQTDYYYHSLYHQPELRLVTAIITRALSDYLLAGRRDVAQEHRRDAETWIFANRDWSYWSFNNLTCLLDLDPNDIRYLLTTDRANITRRFSKLKKGIGDINIMAFKPLGGS